MNWIERLTVGMFRAELKAPGENAGPSTILTAAVIVCCIFTIHGCDGKAGYTTVDFSEIAAADAPGGKDSERPTLKVAVAAMVSPKETFVYYRELLNYIGDGVQHEVQLIQRKTYSEINGLLRDGRIDVAFICTGPYVTGKEAYGFEALATPIVLGEPFYQSYLIVHEESPYQRLEDLRGRVFAFTDPQSNTGFIAPRYWLSQMAEKPDTFFKRVNFTYSHDNSLLAVSRSLVDGAAVDGHIWEYYNRRTPLYTSNTRIIKKSEPFGSPPLVGSLSLSLELKTQIQELIFAMHEDSLGQGILEKLMIDRFVPPSEEWYRPVRSMQMALERFENHGDQES